MRKIAILVLFALTAVSVYAGDVANFVSLGFSPDGGQYAFGQYGVTDSEFTAYADIFCVDVAKNDFVSGGVFSAKPSADPKIKDGRGAFSALGESASAFLKKIGVDNSLQGRPLYVLAEDGQGLKTIAFRDFETGASYEVTLNSLSDGSGAAVRSSFYLVASITGADGKIVRKTIGLPGLKRPGVTGYRVRRIITDASGKSLVFVVEKDLYEAKGTSVRYMVETLRL